MELQWLTVFAIVCVRKVAALNCHQGFNITILGVPFFDWSHNECAGNSACFAQEIVTRFPHPGIELKVRYGGCVARSYSDPLACKSLFGEDSNLDPSTVFNMLPGIDSIIHTIENQIKYNITEAYRSLFSNGTGTESFIDGCFKLLDNLGINTAKALPLKDYIVDLINVTLPRPQYWKDTVTISTGIPQSEINNALDKLLAKLRPIIDAYKVDYPTSEFPELVWRTAQYLNTSFRLPPSSDCYYGHYALNFDPEEMDECVRSREVASAKLNDLMIDILVDLQFAIIHELDVIMELNIIEEILKAFPKYEFYIRLLQLLDRGDIKEIYKIFPKYLMSVKNDKREGYVKMFVAAFNVTIARITSKFGEFSKELRQRFAPKTCKLYTCHSNWCNAHEKLTDVKQMVFREFNEKDPTSSKEAQKSPRTGPRVAASISNPSGDNTDGFTENPHQRIETTSSSTSHATSFPLIALTISAMRALI